MIKKSVSFFLFFVLINFSLIAVIPVGFADGEGWLSGWYYRKSHTFTGSETASTNYQMLITVDYGSGSDSGDTVYLDGKCEADFDDLRFTDNDGSTLLDYWIEEKTDSDYALVWIEIADSLSSGESPVIYVYYGNAAASSLSNPVNTLLLWEPFDNISSWTVEFGTWSASGGYARQTLANWGGMRRTFSNDDVRIRTKAINNDNYDLRIFGRVDGSISSGTGYLPSWYPSTLYSKLFRADGGSHTALATLSAANTNSWKIYDFCMYGSSLRAYIDGSLDNSATDSTYSDGDYIGLGCKRSTYFDYLYITKWVYPEPSHSSWGSEETAENYPVNYSLSISNLDSGVMFAQYKTYFMDLAVYHEDGYSALDYIEGRIKQSSTSRAVFRYDEDSEVFSIESGSSEFSLISGSCSASESGLWVNVSFAFMVQWDAVEEADVELEAYSVDNSANSDTDVLQSNYCDIICSLIVSGFTCDDDRGSLEQSLIFSGVVYYVSAPGGGSASAFYPPDSEFTAVHVYDSGDNDLGSDSSIINGAFSVSVTASSSVELKIYNPYLDLSDADFTDAEDPSTDTFISDRIQLLTLSSNDTALYVNEYSEIRATAQLDYDDSALGSGDSLSVEGLDLSWDAVNSWFDAAETYAVETHKTYNEGSGLENSFGITAFDQNSLSLLVEWFASEGGGTDEDFTDPGDLAAIMMAGFILLPMGIIILFVISRRKR